MANKNLRGRPVAGPLPNWQLKRFIWLLISGLVIYLIVAGLAGIGRTVRIITGADSLLLFAAMAAVAASYICASLTNVLLAEKSIAPLPTLMIQIAGGLANRLLPGGLGGLGINAWYLHRQGHAVGVATAIVAANNGLGFAGNMVLLGIAATIPGAKPALHVASLSLPALIIAAILALVIIIVSGNSHVRRHLRGEATAVRRYLRVILRRPFKGTLALLSSMSLTSFHVIALMLTAHALGLSFAWKTGLYAISAGALAGAVVPTPGGLGGAEAGIAGVLIASGISAGDAASTALLYRFLTYWLPLLPGYAAMRIVEKRYL